MQNKSFFVESSIKGIYVEGECYYGDQTIGDNSPPLSGRRGRGEGPAGPESKWGGEGGVLEIWECHAIGDPGFGKGGVAIKLIIDFIITSTLQYTLT